MEKPVAVSNDSVDVLVENVYELIERLDENGFFSFDVCRSIVAVIEGETVRGKKVSGKTIHRVYRESRITSCSKHKQSIKRWARNIAKHLRERGISLTQIECSIDGDELVVIKNRKVERGK